MRRQSPTTVRSNIGRRQWRRRLSDPINRREVPAEILSTIDPGDDGRAGIAPCGANCAAVCHAADALSNASRRIRALRSRRFSQESGAVAGWRGRLLRPVVADSAVDPAADRPVARGGPIAAPFDDDGISRIHRPRPVGSSR